MRLPILEVLPPKDLYLPPSFSLHLFVIAINVTEDYTIAAGGILVLLFIVKYIPFFQYILGALAILTAKYLVYLLLVRRYRLLGPWNRADVLLQLLYFAMNILYITFRVSAIKEAGARAGTLAIINLAPSFFGLYLSSLADLLGISLSNYRQIHRMTG